MRNHLVPHIAPFYKFKCTFCTILRMPTISIHWTFSWNDGSNEWLIARGLKITFDDQLRIMLHVWLPPQTVFSTPEVTNKSKHTCRPPFMRPFVSLILSPLAMQIAFIVERLVMGETLYLWWYLHRWFVAINNFFFKYFLLPQLGKWINHFIFYVKQCVVLTVQ